MKKFFLFIKGAILLLVCSIVIVMFFNNTYDSIETISDGMTITMPNGEKSEIQEKEIQEQYLDVFENKQKIKNKPGYLSINNKYIIEHAMNGQQGTFELFIQPCMVEVMIAFNRGVTRGQITDLVDDVLSVTELEIDDLVFKDVIGFIVDAYFYNEGLHKIIKFKYPKNEKVTIYHEPTLAGFSLAITVEKMEDTLKVLKQICGDVAKFEYEVHYYPSTPKGIIPHLYKCFVIDSEENWYRVSNDDVIFLIERNEIYSSLNRLD